MATLLPAEAGGGQNQGLGEVASQVEASQLAHACQGIPLLMRLAATALLSGRHSASELTTLLAATASPSDPQQAVCAVLATLPAHLRSSLARLSPLPSLFSAECAAVVMACSLAAAQGRLLTLVRHDLLQSCCGGEAPGLLAASEGRGAPGSGGGAPHYRVHPAIRAAVLAGPGGAGRNAAEGADGGAQRWGQGQGQGQGRGSEAIQEASAVGGGASGPVAVAGQERLLLHAMGLMQRCGHLASAPCLRTPDMAEAAALPRLAEVGRALDRMGQLLQPAPGNPSSPPAATQLAHLLASSCGSRAVSATLAALGQEGQPRRLDAWVTLLASLPPLAPSPPQRATGEAPAAAAAAAAVRHEQQVLRANVLHRMASTLRAAGRFEDALQAAEQATELRRLSFGTGHVDTLACVAVQGRCLSGLGRHAEALHAYILVLEQLVGVPSLLPAARFAAATAATPAKLSAGKEEQGGAVVGCSTLEGAAVVVEALRCLADTVLHLNLGPQACVLAECAHTLSRACLGPVHRESTACLHALTTCQSAAGQLDLALLLLARQRRLLGGLAGPQSLDVLRSAMQAAVCAVCAARWQGQEQGQGQQQGQKQGQAGVKDPIKAQGQAGVRDQTSVKAQAVSQGQVGVKAQAVAQALVLSQEALDAHLRVLGGVHLQTVGCRLLLGSCLSRLGRHEDAQVGVRVPGEGGGGGGLHVEWEECLCLSA